MRIHRRLLAVAALAVLAASAGAASLTSAAPSPARLRAFEGCPSFLAYVRKEALPLVGPSGLGSGVVGIGATAPPAPPATQSPAHSARTPISRGRTCRRRA